MSRRQAEVIRHHIDALVVAVEVGQPPETPQRLWLQQIGEDLAKSLARVGLIDQPAAVYLGEWLENYFRQRKNDIKPAILAKWRQTKDRLIAAFGADKRIREITVADAAEWWSRMRATLSEASCEIHGGNAKQFGNEWVRRGMVDKNPFSHVKSGPTASKVFRFVTSHEIAKILPKCPNQETRLALALTRYAGLRFMTEQTRCR